MTETFVRKLRYADSNTHAKSASVLLLPLPLWLEFESYHDFSFCFLRKLRYADSNTHSRSASALLLPLPLWLEFESYHDFSFCFLRKLRYADCCLLRSLIRF
jgi:tryptophan-rich sensory protein